VFVALGVLLPYAFHAFLAGPIFLPMHIPVLLAGLLLGPLSGAVVGLLSPLISSATGMPTLFMLPIMTAQLSATGFIAGMLTKRFKVGVFIALPVAMVLGRLVFAAVFYLVTLGFGFSHGSIAPALNANSVWAFLFIIGLPGIAVQLVIIPMLVKAVESGGIPMWKTKNSHLIKKASSLINSEKANFVLIKDKKIQLHKKEIGVKSALKLHKENPKLLENAILVDKVVGKAAAILFTLSKIKFVHAHIISNDAKEFLLEHNIAFSFQKKVPYIKNRTKDSMCPLESAVIGEECPTNGLEKIEKKIAELMEIKK